ncbi:MAG TPA: methyltransferase [Patescibacteria group bacterium]|nr:methyltransferase [Patescibacteria group bacterium]
MAVNIDELRKDTLLRVDLLGQQVKLFTTWGLFSPKEIDEGSLLLLKHLEIKPTDDVLDLGCGYGVLGLLIAKLAPQGTTHLVDKDFVAIQYARKNAKINEIKNVQVYLSNGFNDVPDDKKFDVIVSNLPAKTGKELHYILLHDAKEHLKPGGKLYVVTISGLKEYIKRTFQEVFGNYEKLGQSKSYSVAVATK